MAVSTILSRRTWMIFSARVRQPKRHAQHDPASTPPTRRPPWSREVFPAPGTPPARPSRSPPTTSAATAIGRTVYAFGGGTAGGPLATITALRRRRRRPRRGRLPTAVSDTTAVDPGRHGVRHRRLHDLDAAALGARLPARPRYPPSPSCPTRCATRPRPRSAGAIYRGGRNDRRARLARHRRGRPAHPPRANRRPPAAPARPRRGRGAAAGASTSSAGAATRSTASSRRSGPSTRARGACAARAGSRSLSPTSPP